MTVRVYADEMILINFAVNIFIVEITKRVLKHSVSLLKEVCCALAVSIIYTVFIISDFRIYINFITVLILNICEIILLFKPNNALECVKASAVFKLTALSADGCMLLINAHLRIGFNYIVLALSFAATYLSYILLNALSSKAAYYPINIKWSSKVININALVDTGNCLVEPISSKPVIVTEYSVLKDVLPKGLVEIYENKKESNLMEIAAVLSDDSLRKSMRVIPFNSVGNEKGMMIGFVADSVRIKDKVINKPIIGVCRFNLSGNGLYSALISPKHLGGI